MERRLIEPRPNWEAEAEEVGFLHHTVNGDPYWAEDRYYAFTMAEVESIERATNDLHAMCLHAAEDVITNNRYAELAIPEHAIPLIERSWEDDAPSIYGRFDLAFSGGEPKMLEYNADTPTSLIEASVAQWMWLQSRFPKLDQFNSIHEKLIGYWAYLRPYLKGPLYLASTPDAEDVCTVNYMRDVASQAGLKTEYIDVNNIGWHAGTRAFVDEAGKVIDSAFVLYPWEWMIHEGFVEELLETNGKVQWIEPAWKMILSNKGILPILWDLFPDHPNLLPAYKEEYLFKPGTMYVQKPLLSREGANVAIHNGMGGVSQASKGDYGEEGFVFQEYARISGFGSFTPIVGSWVIGGEAAGMGIRESEGLITDNLSRFVPHVIL